ncbi:ATP-grasp domain-containing protein [Hoeflea poritis]|uniref:ATP-grasp domain-containing protein n=1 Tax=Hoeflea poritis TaxID=2993659 RepID=A0ABT4VMG8_9HYPH|nr:ATP-grasp domain-containing protein [Hoeflea poritis]MDA4845243.1 ATP-grasp domain-containing protein [Hoeflea poritis]
MTQEIIFVEASVTGAGYLASVFAREEGLSVTLLTRDPAIYATDLLAQVDDVITCDTDSAQVVAQIAKARARDRSVVALTTTADMYVPQAAFAAQTLGLPGLRYQAALRARNKHKMREALAEQAPDCNTEFALVMAADEVSAAQARLGLPLIAKPQEENDGIGVRLIRSTSELETYVSQALSRTHNSAGQSVPPGVLLEAFIDWPEFSVETIQYPGGPCQVIGVTLKQVIGQERAHFVEAGHVFPYAGPEVEVATTAVVRVLGAMGIDHGAVHTECRVRAQEVAIMEINPRLAGGKIGSHLIEMATGVSAVNAVVEAALGRRRRWAALRQQAASIQNVWASCPGVFQGIRNVDYLRGLPGITSVSTLVEPGTLVGPPTKNGDSIAEILAVGADFDTAKANAERALAEIDVDLVAA